MKDRLKNVPLQPGVYLYKDKEGQVIYVGKAKALRNRMRSYFQSPDGLLPKVRAMMNRVADFDYIVTNSEVEALILESNLIKAYQPRYNIDLRDDKSYPYLKLTADKFPRLCIVREKKDKVSRYYGPYTEVGSLRETVKLLLEIFPLRTCKNLKSNSRPCLNFDMGKCLAPCNGKVDAGEYQRIVDSLLEFLEGKASKLLEGKEKEMREASLDLEFEKAAHLRDQIQAIKVLGEKQKVSLDHPYEMDIVGMLGGEKDKLILVFKLRAGKIVGKDTFWLKRAIDEEEAEVMEFFLKQYYADNSDIPAEILVSHLPGDNELLQTWLKGKAGSRIKIWMPGRGEKKKLLDMVMGNAGLLWEEKMREDTKNNQVLLALARTLNLEVVPVRIECYDISHLAGEETVASMVVFTNGKADKKAYRRFKMKNEQNNDYASLSETLERRFTEARRGNRAFLPEPDLLLIDGGLGQVNAVQMSLAHMGIDIPVFGLAKKNEELFRPGISEAVVLSRRDEGLMLLQRLRDEAHRFAVEYNRQRRGKKLTRSLLDEIEGIGSNRKNALLAHFGSVSKIKEASLDQLLQVPRMNSRAAASVYAYFHSNN
ncbi:MAG: excinuclease ABC subunit C [Firmicutes bacterium HGW-Firmicutes-15]|nr:MAG: excinuclease ABC subunit C [Firmicutes bacterium HGW-Firmicutes-15]